MKSRLTVAPVSRNGYTMGNAAFEVQFFIMSGDGQHPFGFSTYAQMTQYNLILTIVKTCWQGLRTRKFVLCWQTRLRSLSPYHSTVSPTV